MVESFSLQFILTLAVLGVGIGLISGITGIGGGVLMIPALILLLPPDVVPEEARMPLILGSSITVAGMNALVSFLVHRTRIADLGRDGVILGIAAVVGAQGGVATAAALPSATLETLFALLLLLLTPLLIAAPEKKLVKENDAAVDGSSSVDVNVPIPPKSNLRHIVIFVGLGVVLGFVSGTVGLGGALLAIPVLILVLKLPSRRAIGLATTMMLFTAFSASIGFMYHGFGEEGLPPYSIGFVNLVIVGALAVGTVPLAMYGAGLVHRINVRLLRTILGIVVGAIALFLLLT